MRTLSKKIIPRKEEATDIIYHINQLVAQKSQYQTAFNECIDIDLTEAHIYELKAIEARYRYLFKKLYSKS